LYERTQTAAMTGIDWLDWAASALFAAMALVLGVQLARGREVLAHRASGLHVVMALGMAAMSQPRLNPLPAEIWMVAFAGSAVMAPFRCKRAPGHAVHHVVGSLFMVVAFAAGHGAHTDAAAADVHRMVDPVTGETVTMAGASHTGGSGHHGAHGGAATADAAGITSVIGDAAAWPVWPLVGAGFALFAVWHVWGLCGRRFPVVATAACPTTHRLPDLTCGALMAAAMATMAFML